MQPNEADQTKPWLWPVVGALACLGLGLASGWFSAGGGDAWYRSLEKPPGQPPGWVFGPVWTLLYLWMGTAAGRLIRRRAWKAVRLFGVQFLLNLAWTPVFFGAQQVLAALLVIVGMWIALFLTIREAQRTDRMAFWLLIPYLAWVTYATYLNAAIFWLNR